MPLHLTPKASGITAIAVCDRCNLKVHYTELRADGNSPGLRVCSACYDARDPYRLPARQAENITLRFPRPDATLEVPNG